MSGSLKEWLIVLGMALFVHVGAAVIWWWTPTIDFPDPGASSMKLALAPGDTPRDDRAETVPVDQDDPVPPELELEPEPEPVIEPIIEPVEPVVAPQTPPLPAVQPTPNTERTEPVVQAPASTEQPNASTQSVETGRATAEIGVADASVEADYIAQLASWLARHKQYPRTARRRNLEGVAQLTFTLNAEGKVLKSDVTGSSGYQVLDREVVKMLERAEPLPAFPTGLNRRTMEIIIPIRFELERD